MSDAAPKYQVLARKYRPETFADLVGQDAMVRTLKNAFAADRIAQAFVMTGIRGTGKTTTARIIAKGMNCVGPDGTIYIVYDYNRTPNGEVLMATFMEEDILAGKIVTENARLRGKVARLPIEDPSDPPQQR